MILGNGFIFLLEIDLNLLVISFRNLFDLDSDELTVDVSFAVFFITYSYSKINNLKAVISVLTLKAPTPQNGQTYLSNCLSVFHHFVGLALKELNTDVFSSDEAILSYSNRFVVSGISFYLILTTEDVSQFNGNDLSEILGWMGSFRNIWSSVK